LKSPAWDVGQQFQLDLELEVLRRARAPGSDVTISSFGITAGRRSRSVSNCCVASLIDCSITSAATAPPNRWRTMGMGTLPGRKPGMLTCFASSENRDKRAGLDVRGGYDHRESALQAVGKCLGHLHLPIRSIYLVT
jgi:hypothetical protein